MSGGKSGERGIRNGREVRGRKARGNRKTRMDRSIRAGQAESEGEGGDPRVPIGGADILCTPVKWPMQIERHRWTVGGVHVSVNEPISTSFLLFDSFSERRHRRDAERRFPAEEADAEFWTFAFSNRIVLLLA